MNNTGRNEKKNIALRDLQAETATENSLRRVASDVGRYDPRWSTTVWIQSLEKNVPNHVYWVFKDLIISLTSNWRFFDDQQSKIYSNRLAATKEKM